MGNVSFYEFLVGFLNCLIHFSKFFFSFYILYSRFNFLLQKYETEEEEKKRITKMMTAAETEFNNDNNNIHELYNNRI